MCMYDSEELCHFSTTVHAAGRRSRRKCRGRATRVWIIVVPTSRQRGGQHAAGPAVVALARATAPCPNFPLFGWHNRTSLTREPAFAAVHLPPEHQHGG